jgi:hypothetical protein
MRKELGVLLVEGNDENVAVQLFSDVVSVSDAFNGLKGKATLITLLYGEDGSEVRVAAMSVVLPVPIESRPAESGVILGGGPVRVGPQGIQIPEAHGVQGPCV